MSSDAPMPAPRLTNENTAAPWRTCLHEAGHAVAGWRLLHRTTRAAVFGNGSGVADLGGEGGVPVCFKDAAATAAGKAAESLADLYPPPLVAMAEPLEKTYPEEAGRLMAGVASLMPDEVAIARWCIEGREDQPNLWAKRHDWVRASASEFVLEYQHEIVETAAGLYARGVITLPAEPAQEGTVHVD